MESSADALRVLGISDPDSLLKSPPSAQVPVLAPVAGEVTDRLVGPGQLLQAGVTQCFTISDMSTVWVLVNVYQNDLADVHQGDAVDITTDAYPDTFRGKISYIAATLDPNTRTLQARIVTDNPGQKLKNNMYVSAIVAPARFGMRCSCPMRPCYAIRKISRSFTCKAAAQINLHGGQ